MATANQILREVPDAELRLAAAEALDWSRTGVLTGDALRRIAERLQAEAGLAEDGVLRDTDTLVCREAARRFVAAGACSPTSDER